MPDGSVPLLLVLIILVILSGFFSATETAYTSLNKIKIKSLMNEGNKRAKQVYNLCEKYESLLTTTLIGNNIVNLSAASVGGVLFAKLITGGGIDPSVLSTMVLTVVILIFGEITPKLLAKSYPENVAMTFYPIIMFFYYVLFPLNFIFSLYQKLIAIIFKVQKDDAITDEQLMTIVDEAEEDGVLEEDESDLVRSALEFGDSEAGDILVPRVKIVAVSVNQTMEEIRKTFNESGFSRLLVYKDSIDNVIGFIHEKDFYNSYLNGGKDIRSILKHIINTSEHTKISELLKTLQGSKSQIAAVYDEYGGLLGMLTIEDILEELVGEIWDEHDEEEHLIKKVSDEDYIVCGNCDVDALFDELGMDSKESDDMDSNTVGGLITEKLEGIPEVGESVDIDNLHMEVVKASDKQVLEVKVTLHNSEDKNEDDDREKE